jgi:hypothetical protein
MYRSLERERDTKNTGGGWPTTEQKENVADASELRKLALIKLTGEREGTRRWL